MKTEIKIPDLGDFKNVPIIELPVTVGERVELDTPLLLLESDKATMDVPSPVGGTIAEIRVKIGDVVSPGSVVMIIDEDAAAVSPVEPAMAPHSALKPKEVFYEGPKSDLHADLLVLGAGPGGYTAAFRAADLGHKVVLVDRREQLGGVCLNIGCIPSKALLHAAKVLEDSRDFVGHGIDFGEPRIDLGKLRGWKDGIITRLTGGLAGLAKQRKVTVVRGDAVFVSPYSVAVTGKAGVTAISFDQAIIAAGSEPVALPFMPPGDPRVIDSTGALALESIPQKILILGGGIIGLEMATVYHALGSRVTVVELMDQLIPGADRDLVAPLLKRLKPRYESILLKTKVTAVDARQDGLVVHFEGPDGASEGNFDVLLVAVGRTPNGKRVGAAAAGVAVDERGFIPVDAQMRTNLPHIFAIGDVVGQPMLAHKATHQAKVAAEVASGHDKVIFDAKVIPSVAYTDPEIAWVGLTETAAKAGGIKFGKGVFPWAASGRSLSLGRDEGLTKLLFDEETGKLLGAGIVGPNAGELIAEAALAIEMGADAADIALTIHPHPTLSETIGMAAEAFEGTLTDLLVPRPR